MVCRDHNSDPLEAQPARTLKDMLHFKEGPEFQRFQWDLSLHLTVADLQSATVKVIFVTLSLGLVQLLICGLC